MHPTNFHLHSQNDYHDVAQLTSIKAHATSIDHMIIWWRATSQILSLQFVFFQSITFFFIM